MANMIPISTVTVGSGGAASIDFTGIPQTYTDLLIKISGRNSGTNGIVNLSFNSDTTAGNYEGRYLEGNGSTVGSFTDQDRAAGYIDGSGSTANTFGNSETYIPNYTSSNYKSFSVDGLNENNATTAYSGLFANIWKSTSPITSITLTTGSGNFAQYSSATLYGIRKY